MQPTKQNLAHLATQLKNTLNPNVQARQQAEAFLRKHETLQGFPLVLLTLIQGTQYEVAVRQAGAIFFKNFVKRQWDEGKVADNDRNAVKTNIVNLMLSSPLNVRRQLAEAVGLIAKVDFPDKWPQIMPQLLQKLQTQDLNIVIGVLDTCHSIFKDYRHAFKNIELIAKIRYVLEEFANKCWSQCLQRFWGMSKQAVGNKEAGKQVYKIMELLVEIFYSLNWQDIPEYFEDDMPKWTPVFSQIIAHQDPAQVSQTELPSQLTKLKTSVMRAITLYNSQYESQYRQYVPGFVKVVWGMLTSLSSSVANDDLCTSGMKYLNSVVSQEWHKNLFSNQGTLEGIITKVILPNVQLRPADVEMFEMDGEGYMRRDMEGSDQYTRRRMVVNLVQGLCVHFESQVTTILMKCIGQLLQQFNQTKTIALKNAALYLVMAITVQGKINNAATQVNKFVKILPFFQQHVISELNGNPNENQLLKADCIKFVATFRNQLGANAQNVTQLVPILGKYLSVESYVVHTYAASTLEKLFMLRAPRVQGQTARAFVISKQQASQICPKLIVPLFQIMSKFEESQTNPYVMKAIMRLLYRAEEGARGVVGPILQNLTAILQRVSKNPKNPQFNHYMFETISCAIRAVCKGNPGAVQQFEQKLVPMFMQILQVETCLEFHPYAFQVMGQLLRLGQGVSQTYVQLFPQLLQTKHWEQGGNVHGICALFEDYFRKGAANQLLDDGKMQAMLGIFQKLCTKKAHDAQTFKIPSLIILYANPQKWQKYMPMLFKIIFQRLTSKKTDMFMKNFTIFLCLYMYKHGFDQVHQLVNGIQNGIFTMVLNNIIIKMVAKCSDDTDRKVAVVGLTKMLCNGNFLKQYSQQWASALKGVVEIFEIPAEDIEDDGLDALMEGGYQSKMVKLRYADAEDYDPVKDVREPRKLLGQSLAQLSQQAPGQIQRFIGQLDKVHQKCVMEYLQLAGAQLR